MRIGQLEPGQNLPDPSSRVDAAAGIRFLDVGTGGSAIIDMGEREIIIEGGESVAVLSAYAERT